MGDNCQVRINALGDIFLQFNADLIRILSYLP